MEIRKMEKKDLPVLYGIARRAFQPDYDRYGVYPPMLDSEKKTLRPPRVFGKTIWEDGIIIGGAYVVGLGKKGEIGAIFLDPAHQRKGLGGQVMRAVEALYPRVKTWKLETPAESLGLHRFYESLGYQKTGEIRDDKSGMTGFVYEKHM